MLVGDVFVLEDFRTAKLVETETEWSRRVTLDHAVTFAGGADLPVYLRVTQADGHQAWTSPIYLIE